MMKLFSWRPHIGYWRALFAEFCGWAAVLVSTTTAFVALMAVNHFVFNNKTAEGFILLGVMIVFSSFAILSVMFTLPSQLGTDEWRAFQCYRTLSYDAWLKTREIGGWRRFRTRNPLAMLFFLVRGTLLLLWSLFARYGVGRLLADRSK